jgi:tetratricopeptide (TPR) repeat protein
VQKIPHTGVEAPPIKRVHGKIVAPVGIADLHGIITLTGGPVRQQVWPPVGFPALVRFSDIQLDMYTRTGRLTWRLLLSLSAIASVTATAWAEDEYHECGPLRRIGQYGPYDYRAPPKGALDLVESAHFTPGVEGLKVGNTTKHVMGDLSYTLRAIPNHHRALAAVSRLGLREKTRKPNLSIYTIDCWFERAIRFTPDDPKVYVIYGIDLVNVGKPKDAVSVLEKAISMDPSDANALYTLGSAYFDMQKYDDSLRFAKQAYDAGFPLAGLRQKLQKVGKWH